MKSAASFNNHFECSISRGMGAYSPSKDAHHRTFLAISGLLFAVSALVTVLWCNSMSAMGEMRMPGGWTMSMAWMRMPGQTWIEATASFLAMWVVMMAAMMLPSLAPMLVRYRQAVRGSGAPRLALLTVLAGLGYFFVWALFGLAVFPLGVVLATAEMEHSELALAVPFAIGAVIFIAGAVQLTSMEGASPCVLPGNAGSVPHTARRRRHSLAARCVFRISLQPLLRQLDGDSFGIRRNGSARHGPGNGSHHRRAPSTGWKKRRTSHWGRCHRGRIAFNRAISRAPMMKSDNCQIGIEAALIATNSAPSPICFRSVMRSRHPFIDRAGMLDQDSTNLEDLKPTVAARSQSRSRT